MSDDLIIFNNEPALPTRSDALQNRADILEIARRLFQDQGVEKVSMSQIAREANVGKGTLYRHFRNKPDLCIALLDDDQRAFQEQTITYMQDAADGPAKKLMWFLTELCEFTERNISFLCEARAGRLTETTVRLDHPAHHWQWQTIAGLMRQIAPDVDADYFADVIYIMMDAENYQFQRNGRGYSKERIIEGVINTAWRLLGLS